MTKPISEICLHREKKMAGFNFPVPPLFYHVTIVDFTRASHKKQTKKKRFHHPRQCCENEIHQIGNT